ncbi:MAG: hypothetical protein ACOX5Y_02150 [Acholeplasmataceae bacterium]
MSTKTPKFSPSINTDTICCPSGTVIVKVTVVPTGTLFKSS